MSDMTLVLDRKGLTVSMESGTIRIDRQGQRPRRIPVNMVGRVVVHGSPMVSCSVWRTLAEKGIPALIMPLRGKGAFAWAGAGISAKADLRMVQYRAAVDADRSLCLSRWFAGEKLAGQARVLAELGRNPLPDANADIASAGNRSVLMGIEGAAAAFYFKEIAEYLHTAWGFSGRNRRPPRDPANALLSLSYVLAETEIRRILFTAGFDPTIGFLHSVQRGRSSLALDVLEPVRPVIDRFVLLLLEDYFKPDDFSVSSQDGCRLLKDSRAIFYSVWAKWLESPSEGLCRNIKQVVNRFSEQLSIPVEKEEEVAV